MGARVGTAKQQIQRIIDASANAIAQHRLPPGMRLVAAQIVESPSSAN